MSESDFEEPSERYFPKPKVEAPKNIETPNRRQQQSNSPAKPKSNAPPDE